MWGSAMPRYVYFTTAALGKHRWGRVARGGVEAVDGSIFDSAGAPASPGASVTPWPEVVVAPPGAPSKIVCVGRNYHAHAKELGNPVPSEPLLFLKPPSSLLPAGGAIVLPTGQSELVAHEGELGVVIGRRARHIEASEAYAHVLGFTPLNDVTARDLQRKDVQFTRGKGFDTFCPIGPWIDTDFRPADQRLTVSVNGELRQDGRLSQMIFDVPTLIAFVSRVMTLEPGDVIATGTPSGVGPLTPGDEVTVEIEGLGALTNKVVAEA